MKKAIRPKSASRAPTERFRSGASVVIPRDVVAHPVGGHLALDFCNTTGEHLADRPDELLHDWEAFLRWATQVALIGSESYLKLLPHPEPVGPIVRLREAIYRVGLAVVRIQRASDRDLALLCKHANGLRPQILLRKSTLQWRPDPSHASKQLCAVLASEALSLLCSPKARRIRMCEGGKCGWLFLDESRGKRRRWCDMNDCGSRAKARRYYEKHKEP